MARDGSAQCARRERPPRSAFIQALAWLAGVLLQFAGLGTKYTRASSLVGGTVLLALGALLLLRPEWLMFG